MLTENSAVGGLEFVVKNRLLSCPRCFVTASNCSNVINFLVDSTGGTLVFNSACCIFSLTLLN